MKIFIKRVYDQPNPKDGLRILVDRLWPRGISKEEAKIDVWLKSTAPSNELRKWFQHDVKKWPEFKKRYFAELEADTEAVNELLSYVKKSEVTLLFAAKESDHNNAVALKEYINSILSK
ncbi:DUF488 domain-containing protein [Syntrophus aciditrophicus]|jgi:uncharacterized protein YeaO (DUF488 family)|uniref:Hypothetical cytosolic protein n=1 Tax=Syntrophus aciditrophicus (strain SB) TaxID=56780 RepID=Q2LSA6_SYNAS|nr:DUF488 domain-containing protein [Syntrophus aciditrophicus]ABC76968.1 hypothetical cytosolic protein [Syntrophus aciditrophicus SB]OPY18117.1 MAG: hypothetical protein A4E74_00763 [Syntrophus sp. PtaB.Bin075]